MAEMNKEIKKIDPESFKNGFATKKLCKECEYYGEPDDFGSRCHNQIYFSCTFRLKKEVLRYG
jgi:hypothetical protein